MNIFHVFTKQMINTKSIWVKQLSVQCLGILHNSFKRYKGGKGEWEQELAVKEDGVNCIGTEESWRKRGMGDEGTKWRGEDKQK